MHVTISRPKSSLSLALQSTYPNNKVVGFDFKQCVKPDISAAELVQGCSTVWVDLPSRGMPPNHSAILSYLGEVSSECKQRSVPFTVIKPEIFPLQKQPEWSLFEQRVGSTWRNACSCQMSHCLSDNMHWRKQVLFVGHSGFPQRTVCSAKPHVRAHPIDIRRLWANYYQVLVTLAFKP